MKTKVFADVTQTEPVVTCHLCGKKYPVGSDGFIVIFGDIHLGMEIGLVSGNINERGKLVGSFVLCREHAYVNELVKAFLPKQDRKDVG